MSHLLSGHGHVAPILGAIRSSVTPAQRGAGTKAVKVLPFVTISREAGVGARGIGLALVKLLTERDGQPWMLYDRELVEKVAADHDVERSVVDALEDASHSWVKDIFASLASNRDEGNEFRAMRRVAATIRAICEVGRAVVIGRGGAFVTAKLAGGLHVRLIAPRAYRVNRYARQHGVDADPAAAEVKRIDDNRAAFYKTYWPARVADPFGFTMTLNIAHHTDEQVARSILALVHE